MERLLSSRNSYHLARVGIFLITAALIAGMVGCGQPEYTPMVAAGWGHTVGLKSDDTVVGVGLETELAEWNLGVINFEEIPPVNWPLIGGIIAAAAVVGLVTFFVRKRGRSPA